VKNPAPRARRLVRTLVGATTVALLATTGTAYGYVPGVDTSHYQHNPSLDWQKAANDGVEFAFLKATEGTSYRDPYFKADWAATAKAGIYRGAYHFARPSTQRGDAVREADFFADTIGTQTTRGTLPPVLDLETTGGLSDQQLINWTRDFLVELQAKTGRNPIIYVSPYFWKDNVGNSSAFHDYPLWVAHYTTNSQPMIPGGWPTWSFWQTTSSGRISGISGNVDKDLFNGTMSQLQRFALDHTRTATELSLQASNVAPTVGQDVTFSGRLTDDAGHGLAAQQVTLQFTPQGSTTRTTVATLKTGRHGGFRTTLPVSQAGSYRAHFSRTAGYRVRNSAPVSVTLTPLSPDLTLAPSTTSTTAGSPLGLSGSLTQGDGGLANRHVTLFRRVDGTTTWARLGTVTTDSSGTYQLDTTAMHTATYRAKYAGETGYRSARAGAGPVTVRRNPSDISFAVSDDAPYLNQRVSMSGQLVTGTRPVANRPVDIQQKLPDSSRWRTVATATTDAAGHYSFRQRVDTASSFRALFRADSLYARSASSPAALQISPPRRTHTTLTARRTEIRAGRSLMLHGRLTAGGDGLARTVRLWERLPGHTAWHFVYRTATVLPDGTCKISVSPRTTTIYRLIFNGGTRLAHSQDGLRITVS
jgi:GH25 family lysozyme M1 (1,4-beta-N-acetylmuramidase)